MSKRIYLSPPHLTGEEKKYIKQAFNSNWITSLGPNVDAFELEICEYTKSRHCTVLNSGTASIHLALKILNVNKNDTVLCPTFTFVATINPIIYQQAKPIFIDSEKETLNMCPYLLEKAIINEIRKGVKPKVILLVHIYGMPAKLDEIIKISKKYNIPIIEDSADTLGSTYRNKHVGTFGKIGIYSFNGNKIITTSAGGALISNKKEYAEKAKFFATQAKDEAIHYQHSKVGYNYRMSNILAGIGRGQLKVIDNRIKSRREVYEFYKRELSDIKSISFIEEPKSVFSNRWLTIILTDSLQVRERIRLALIKESIESRPLWKPMHLQPIFKHYPSYLNNVAKELFKKGLCLPSGSSMTKKDLIKIVHCIRKVFIAN